MADSGVEFEGFDYGARYYGSTSIADSDKLIFLDISNLTLASNEDSFGSLLDGLWVICWIVHSPAEQEDCYWNVLDGWSLSDDASHRNWNRNYESWFVRDGICWKVSVVTDPVGTALPNPSPGRMSILLDPAAQPDSMYAPLN